MYNHSIRDYYLIVDCQKSIKLLIRVDKKIKFFPDKNCLKTSEFSTVLSGDRYLAMFQTLVSGIQPVQVFSKSAGRYKKNSFTGSISDKDTNCFLVMGLSSLDLLKELFSRFLYRHFAPNNNTKMYCIH